MEVKTFREANIFSMSQLFYETLCSHKCTCHWLIQYMHIHLSTNTHIALYKIIKSGASYHFQNHYMFQEMRKSEKIKVEVSLVYKNNNKKKTMKKKRGFLLLKTFHYFLTLQKSWIQDKVFLYFVLFILFFFWDNFKGIVETKKYSFVICSLSCRLKAGLPHPSKKIPAELSQYSIVCPQYSFVKPIAW